MTTRATTSTDGPWTTRRLLSWMGEAFTKRGLDSPRLLAEMLVAHVLSCDRLKLYTDADRPASPLERESLRGLVGRALKHEPVQYLVGHAWFFGLQFHVDRRVLIPRPSTETIVEHVLQHARTQPGFGGPKGEGALVADICTGSGCIAVALLKHLTGARAVATDLSRGALDVALENAKKHGVSERLDLLEGDLLSPLDEYPPAAQRSALHYLVSNPPYIPDHEWDAVEPNVKEHEPHSALRGGADGMDLVRPIVKDGPAHLRAGGLLLIEVAHAHAKDVLELARAQAMLEDARILRDHEGFDRVVSARRRA
ncbi:MAG: peptide chain release factor N(5)-glutamine methyltransferase [Phycisphaerales bacterium]|nr:peptide chain release factor N(5)-glutamine methyltransferase [Phycisphaerales bacterium]